MRQLSSTSDNRRKDGRCTADAGDGEGAGRDSWVPAPQPSRQLLTTEDLAGNGRRRGPGSRQRPADSSTTTHEKRAARATAETKTLGNTQRGNTQPRSVWSSVLVKSLGIVVSLTALGGIGAASIVAESRGTLQPPKATTPPSRQASVTGDTWLKPTVGPGATASATPGRSALASTTETPAASFEARARQASESPDSDGPPDAKDESDTTEDQNKKQAGITQDGKVILNTADASELTRLPGVGRKRAEAIVQLRTRLGRLRKASDLLRVKGIGVKTLKKMLPHLVLDPPSESSGQADPPHNE